MDSNLTLSDLNPMMSILNRIDLSRYKLLSSVYDFLLLSAALLFVSPFLIVLFSFVVAFIVFVILIVFFLLLPLLIFISLLMVLLSPYLLCFFLSFVLSLALGVILSLFLLGERGAIVVGTVIITYQQSDGFSPLFISYLSIVVVSLVVMVLNEDFFVKYTLSLMEFFELDYQLLILSRFTEKYRRCCPFTGLKITKVRSFYTGVSCPKGYRVSPAEFLSIDYYTRDRVDGAFEFNCFPKSDGSFNVSVRVFDAVEGFLEVSMKNYFVGDSRFFVKVEDSASLNRVLWYFELTLMNGGHYGPFSSYGGSWLGEEFLHAVSLEESIQEIARGNVYLLSRVSDEVKGVSILGERVKMDFKQGPLYHRAKAILGEQLANKFLLHGSIFFGTPRFDLLLLALEKKSLYTSPIPSIKNLCFRKFRSDLNHIFESIGEVSPLKRNEKMNPSKACLKAMETSHSDIIPDIENFDLKIDKEEFATVSMPPAIGYPIEIKEFFNCLNEKERWGGLLKSSIRIAEKKGLNKDLISMLKESGVNPSSVLEMSDEEASAMISNKTRLMAVCSNSKLDLEEFVVDRGAITNYSGIKEKLSDLSNEGLDYKRILSGVSKVSQLCSSVKDKNKRRVESFSESDRCRLGAKRLFHDVKKGSLPDVGLFQDKVLTKKAVYDSLSLERRNFSDDRNFLKTASDFGVIEDAWIHVKRSKKRIEEIKSEFYGAKAEKIDLKNYYEILNMEVEKVRASEATNVESRLSELNKSINREGEKLINLYSVPLNSGGNGGKSSKKKGKKWEGGGEGKDGKREGVSGSNWKFKSLENLKKAKILCHKEIKEKCLKTKQQCCDFYSSLIKVERASFLKWGGGRNSSSNFKRGDNILSYWLLKLKRGRLKGGCVWLKGLVEFVDKKEFLVPFINNKMNENLKEREEIEKMIKGIEKDLDEMETICKRNI